MPHQHFEGARAVQSAVQRLLPPTLRYCGHAIADSTPFVTSAGTGLSLQFRYDPSNLGFQRLPFTHPTVQGLYHQLALESYLAQLHLPRVDRRTHLKKQLFTDHDADRILQKLGPLTTNYWSVTSGAMHRLNHPAQASVELTRDTHRMDYGLKISLWDSDSQPLTIQWLTGPKGANDLVKQTDAAQEVAKAKASSRPAVPLGDSWYAGTTAAPVTGQGAAAATVLNDQLPALFHALVEGDSQSMKRFPFQLFGSVSRREVKAAPTAATSGDSRTTTNYWQNGVFSKAATVAAIPGFSPEADDAVEDKDSSAPPSRVVLNWHLDLLLSRFAYGVAESIGFPTSLRMDAVPSLSGSMSAERNPFRRVLAPLHRREGLLTADSLSSSGTVASVGGLMKVIAVNTSYSDHLLVDEPFRIVSAEPQILEEHYSKSWEQGAGLPQTKGEPCLALRFEVWQCRKVAIHGTAFFSPYAAKGSES